MTRPVRVTIDPTDLDRNGISTAQSPGANAHFDIDGALATARATDRNGIATAQTPAAAGNLDLDGVQSGALGRLSFITIYGANDESGVLFVVSGVGEDGLTTMETITGPNNTTVISAKRFSTINTVYADGGTTGDVEVGFLGIVELATPQHVTAYAPGNEAGDTITVYGKDRYGEYVTDTITGVNADTVAGDVNFTEIDKITTSGAVTSMEIGVDESCESAWIPLNRNLDFNVGIGVVVTGTINYTIQHTFNDVFATAFDETAADPFNHATLASQTANNDGSYANPPVAVRVAVNSSSGGSLVLNVIQEA